MGSAEVEVVESQYSHNPGIEMLHWPKRENISIESLFNAFAEWKTCFMRF